MTLKTKFVFWCSALLAMVLVLGSVSIWNLTSFWRSTSATSAEYDAMDRAEAIAVTTGWLRDSLRGADGSTYWDQQFFVPIQRELTVITGELSNAARVDDGDRVAELEFVRAANVQLAAAVQNLETSSNGPIGAKSEAVARELDSLHQTLVDAAGFLPGAARRHVAAATERVHGRIVWTSIALLLIFLVSAAIHVKQFRMLVRPLLLLREQMHRSAAREFKDDISPEGSQEFRDVAGYFNGLARQLAELYWNLEKKVIARSRELVRSERLASVGFLAAGVAHEINNPLSIISGYAELAAKSLRRVLLGEGGAQGNEVEAAAEAEDLSSALDAQEIIREEAFRCKEITSRLLALARGGGDNRTTLQLDEVARQVSVLTRGLKNYNDRRVVLDFKHSGPLEVIGNLTEMKQVLLNLTVNALEAVPPNHGEVRIGGRRRGEWIELSVEDNGKGMSAETLEHVFEPFFTAKRGAGEPGTGLGLSITHAIVENHGGRIDAQSDGPGHGSRFTVRLPAQGPAMAS